MTHCGLFFLAGMKLFYTSSVAQQLMQSRSLHLQTPHQGGKLLPARPLFFLLPYHPSLIFPPQTKLTYYTCQSSSILPYIPCSQHCCPSLFPPRDYCLNCCVIACNSPLRPPLTHTHTKCFFSLSSNIYFHQPTFMLVPLLTVCDTDMHMLHSSPSNYLSHSMRFLDTAGKVQQKSPSNLRVLSHTLRQGGGSIFACVRWSGPASKEQL